MFELTPDTKIGVIGCGTMGIGIAQIAAQSGHDVVVYDIAIDALDNAKNKMSATLDKLVSKGKINTDEKKGILSRLTYSNKFADLKGSGFVIEAIIEDINVKADLFRKLEEVLEDSAILATNTSSLSIGAVAKACSKPERVIGAHFFNPAPVMKLVEIIPGLQTDNEVLASTRNLIDSWGKTTAVAKDTPGFIVNRVARPFYGEALRIFEEGVADFATIDNAMVTHGGFKMGPFELMDFIGNDVNYKVTETVFEQMYFDPRYKPSITQKRYMESGLYGRKSGRGFYDYSDGAEKPDAEKDRDLGISIFNRILYMLINEAVDAVFMNVATPQDIDNAMTKGVNYPKGLLKWCDEVGAEEVLTMLEIMYDHYGEDRYRPSPLLRSVAKDNRKFIK